MAQQTMTEKEMYLGALKQEDEISLRVLRAYPPDKIDFKPHPTAQTAGKIAWTLAMGHMVPEAIIKGELTPAGMPSQPSTWQEIVDGFERARRDAVAKIGALREEDLNGNVRMPIGPGKMGEMRKGAALWFFLHDGIHHRGQLSVYLRMVGGKVPSIYGPSGDEPWF